MERPPGHDSVATPAGSLNLFDTTMLVMGGIIGVGIFFKPQGVARLLSDPVPYFSVWVLGAIAALVGAMTFAELAGSFPNAGGWYVFLREAFGGLPAFLFAWIVLFVISTGAAAIVAEFCGQMLQALFWSESGAPPSARILGMALIGGVTALALTGLKTSALFQNVCMISKLAAIAVLAVAGLAFFGDAPLSSVPQITHERPESLFESMIAAMLPVLFAYGGWQLVTYVAPHVRNAPKNLPRSIVLGVAGVAVVYLVFNAAYVRVLGLGAIADLPDVTVTMAERTLGSGGATFLTAAMAVSALGFLVATLISTPGIYVAMAREGLFMRAIGEPNPRTGAPVLALLIQAGVSCVYLFTRKDIVNDLGDAVVFAEWIFHGLTGLALIHLRRTRPELPRPFKSFAFPLFPAAYALLATFVVIGNLRASDKAVTALGLQVLAVGAVVYYPWRALSRRARRPGGA